ncbi:MAG: hypothetical protein ACI8Z1_003744 [Candidatus Azotimanducaceae bacterium]|jgi:uncharacterized protein (DUF924 family)
MQTRRDHRTGSVFKKSSSKYFCHIRGMALVLSQEAVDLDLRPLNSIERSFLYMPFMHSESLRIH